MDQLIEGTMDTREIIKGKLREHFDGKIVRKDLTKKIKEGANVPVYVLEFLLGQYCSSDDEEVIEKGVENVKRILADNFVRPDEAQKILSMLRSRGSYTVIDKITFRSLYSFLLLGPVCLCRILPVRGSVHPSLLFKAGNQPRTVFSFHMRFPSLEPFFLHNFYY